MKVSRLSTSLTAVGLAAVSLAPVAAPASQAQTLVTPTLVAIRAAHHPGFDRVVFTFRRGLPSSVRARYVARLIADPSGRPVPVPGARSVLWIRFAAATAHNAQGPTAPALVRFALPNVKSAVRAGDFEGVLTYGIGVSRRTSFHIFRLQRPFRVAVDISTRR